MRTSAASILSHTVIDDTRVIRHDNYKSSQRRETSAALRNEQERYSGLHTKKSSEILEEFIETWPLLCCLFLGVFACTYHPDIFNGIRVIKYKHHINYNFITT